MFCLSFYKLRYHKKVVNFTRIKPYQSYYYYYYYYYYYIEFTGKCTELLYEKIILYILLNIFYVKSRTMRMVETCSVFGSEEKGV